MSWHETKELVIIYYYFVAYEQAHDKGKKPLVTKASWRVKT